MEYLLKSSAIIIIFYVCYQLFLQRDTFFESNRWFLLFGLIIASCIGFIVIPHYIEYTPVEPTNFTVSSLINMSPTPIESEPFNHMQLLYWLYFAGVIFFFGRLCIQLLSLRKILKHGNTKQFQKYNLVESEENIAPFSFFNFIVYNPSHFSASELEHVINHEKAHSKQLHSIDNIIAQFACIILWFNPFIWLYKKTLLQNLEFIADQKAQYISSCKKSYQTVLLKASVQNLELAITNNFYTSLIKKRIIMLHKSKSKKWNQVKLFIVLPLLAIFIMSFNVEDVYVEKSSASTEEANNSQDSETIEIIFTKNASDEDLENIKETLKSKGITFTYEVVNRNSKGEITAINTSFKNEKNSTNYNILEEDGIKPFKFTCSNENFHVGTFDKNTFFFKSKNGKSKVQSTNGTSKVIVIEEEEEEEEEDDDDDDDDDSKSVDVKVIKNQDTRGKSKNTFVFSSGDEDSKIIISETDEPIFIINGKKVDKSLFEDVDSDDIESIFVLKGDRALKKFGKDGKNGAIIMTKKGAKGLFSDDEDTIILNSKNQFTFETDGKQPLIILNGKVIDQDDLSEVSPNMIENVEVLKDKNAIKTYGKKGENGVIIITSKDDAATIAKDKPIIIEIAEDSPNTFKTAITSVYYMDDNDSKSIEFVINKHSSDAFLDKQKSELKKHGIDAKFSKIKRNKNGDITSIKITLDDNNGRKSSASWKEKNQAIPNIVMGKSNDDKLYIQAIGN